MITNLLNGKKYIGQTIYSLEHRWLRHLSAARCGSKFRFHSAIRKYGPDPWKKEILFEADDLSLIREQEEKLIYQHKTLQKNLGYNAKPGGCGGWIIKDVEKRKMNRIEVGSGFNNANAGDITNEEIITIALDFCDTFNRIPSLPSLRKYAEDEFNKYIPKSFSNFRFNGRYRNLVKILEEKTSLTFNKFFKDGNHRKNISNAQKNRIKNDKN